MSAFALPGGDEEPPGRPRVRRPSEWPLLPGNRASEQVLLRSEQVLLSNGRKATLRPVRPQDAPAEHRFIQSLSPRSRLMRFHGAVNLLPATVLRKMTQVDQQQHVALVAVAATDDGAPLLVADARYVIDAHDPAGADFALAVADDWQRLGLGRRLLQRLAGHAAQQGVRRLHGSVMAGNEPMLALMRHLGASWRSEPGDASTLTAVLPA
ncbi:MAG TPA: GNAT family N-acetyltransferase [Rubrivivax sp.]|nr:GNAT family N-acetyltransferase [Rubrivivax sp.]